MGGNTHEGYELKPDNTTGIKKAWYKLPDDIKSYKSFYLNVVKTDSSETQYSGTLQGHGVGIRFKDEGKGYKRILNNGKAEE